MNNKTCEKLMTKYLVLHSTNCRDTMMFDGEEDPSNSIFSVSQATKAVRHYKNTATQDPNATERLYMLAGIVEAADLDGAYRMTNHVDGTEDWDKRSTSVGDVIIELDDEYDYVSFHVVDRFGFFDLQVAS